MPKEGVAKPLVPTLAPTLVGNTRPNTVAATPPLPMTATTVNPAAGLLLTNSQLPPTQQKPMNPLIPLQATTQVAPNASLAQLLSMMSNNQGPNLTNLESLQQPPTSQDPNDFDYDDEDDGTQRQVKTNFGLTQVFSYFSDEKKLELIIVLR